MKAFDPNYKLLDEMYQDNYYPASLVDKVKDELQKVIDLLENGETDTEVVQETLDEAVCGINDLQEEFDEHDSEIETVARECIGAIPVAVHTPAILTMMATLRVAIENMGTFRAQPHHLR